MRFSRKLGLFRQEPGNPAALDAALVFLFIAIAWALHMAFEEFINSEEFAEFQKKVDAKTEVLRKWVKRD